MEHSAGVGAGVEKEKNAYVLKCGKLVSEKVCYITIGIVSSQLCVCIFKIWR